MKSDALRSFRNQLLSQTRQQYAALIAPGRRMATANPQRIADALQQIGKIESEIGEKSAAAEAYLDAFNEWKRLAEAGYEPLAFARQQIECLCAAALAQTQIERKSEAQANAQLALQLAERCADADAHSMVAKRDLARCRHTLGVLAYQRGDMPTVMAEMEAELPFRTQVAQETGAADDHAALAENWNLLALGWHKGGRPNQPESRRTIVEYYKTALSEIQLAQQIAGPDDPNQVTFRSTEAGILSNKGMADRNREYVPNDPAEIAAWIAGFRQAIQTFEQAVAVNRKLVAEHPAYSAHRRGLAIALGNLADSYVTLGELENSIAPRSESVRIYRELVERFPDVLHYRSALLVHVVRLADTYHRTNRDAEAVRELRVLEELDVPLEDNPESGNPHQWILTAICWSLLAADEQANPPADPSRCRYSATEGNSVKVLEFIGKALDTNWAKVQFDSARLQTDPAFDPYRHLPEFQALLERERVERKEYAEAKRT